MPVALRHETTEIKHRDRPIVLDGHFLTHDPFVSPRKNRASSKSFSLLASPTTLV